MKGLSLVALLLTTSAASASCSVVGDSIAVGTGGALKGCQTVAKVGASGDAIAGKPYPAAAFVVVSMGSNPTDNLEADMQAVRSHAPGAKFIWIIPQPKAKTPRAPSRVRAFATAHGDGVVTFVAGKEGIHPRSYQAVARDVLALMR